MFIDWPRLNVIFLQPFGSPFPVPTARLNVKVDRRGLYFVNKMVESYKETVALVSCFVKTNYCSGLNIGTLLTAD